MAKNITKILLINPASVVKKSWVEGIQTFPLGLASIAGMLLEHGYEVSILDCFIEDFNNQTELDAEHVQIGMDDSLVLDRIRSLKPDLIGIGIQFSIQLTSSLRLVSKIRSEFSTLIVAGGNHVSAAPETLARSGIDWLILGEGEKRMLHLIRAAEAGDMSNLGIEFIDLSGGSSSEFSQITPGVIDDLDELPMPRYDLLPMEKYWAMAGSRFANMFITRGCPYNCIFCSIHTIMGRKVRKKSTDKVIHELRYLHDTLQINEIFIEDDNLTFDVEWAKQLFRKIIAENIRLKIHFRNGIRADKVDLELLKLMKKAGVVQIAYAPETGSQQTLDKIIDKHFDLKQGEKAIKMANKAGIYVSCFLIIGFPEETMDDIRQTIDYAFYLKKIGSDNVWISCAVPYPGTRLYRQCVERKIISQGPSVYLDLATMGSVISNEHFTAEEIKLIRDEAMHKLTANRKLYLLKQAVVNPYIFFYKIRNIILRRI